MFLCVGFNLLFEQHYCCLAYGTKVLYVYNFSNMPTSSRVAIVTGGNSGMGMGIVRRLVEKEWKVAIADIVENKDFAKELGDGASYHKCNVADYDRSVGFLRG